ncbi:hypothetical protein ACWDDN_26075 [Streptomyces griseoruber]
MSNTAPPSIAPSRCRTSSGASRTGVPVPSNAPSTPPSITPGGPAKSQAAYDRTGTTVPNTCEVVDKILYRGSKLVTLNARRTTTSTPGSSPTTG